MHPSRRCRRGPVQVLTDFLHKIVELFLVTTVMTFGLEQWVFRLLDQIDAIVEHSPLGIQLALEDFYADPGWAIEPIWAHKVIHEGAALFEHQDAILSMS